MGSEMCIRDSYSMTAKRRCSGSHFSTTTLARLRTTTRKTGPRRVPDWHDPRTRMGRRSCPLVPVRWMSALDGYGGMLVPSPMPCTDISFVEEECLNFASFSFATTDIVSMSLMSATMSATIVQLVTLAIDLFVSLAIHVAFVFLVQHSLRL